MNTRAFCFLLCLLPTLVFADKPQHFFEAKVDNPYTLFQSILDYANAENVEGTDYAVLATVNENMYPEMRLMYVELSSNLGFIFKTQKKAPKHKHMQQNQKAALLFSLILNKNQHMQIHIVGDVKSLKPSQDNVEFIDYLLKPNKVIFSLQDSTQALKQHYFIVYLKEAKGWNRVEVK